MRQSVFWEPGRSGARLPGVPCLPLAQSKQIKPLLCLFFLIYKMENNDKYLPYSYSED